MKNYAILRDAVEEKVFGLVIEQDGGYRFYGADDRAKEWANWANSTSLKSLQEALPVGVIANSKRPLANDTELFIESLIESASMAGEVKKPTFSYKGSFVTQANSSTPSARDFQLRSFDVGTRQNAINFKVFAFKNDQKSSSLMAKIRSAGLGFNEKTGEFRSNDITISHSSLQQNIESTYTKSLQRHIGFNVMAAKNVYAKSLNPFYTHPSVLELKKLGGAIGPKLGRGLRSAPMGMVFVDVTGAIDADKDGIVFEGKPGLERPIVPKFILPEGVGRRVASLIGGAAEENEKNRRAGIPGGGVIDETKLRDILGADAPSLNKLNAPSPLGERNDMTPAGMRSIAGNIRSRRDAIIAKRTGSDLSRVGRGGKTQVNTGDSRAIEKMSWDDDAKELIVTFAGGRTYTYNGVDDKWVKEIETNPDALGRIMNDIKKAGYDFTPGGTHAPDKTLASRMQGRREAAGMRSARTSKNNPLKQSEVDDLFYDNAAWPSESLEFNVTSDYNGYDIEGMNPLSDALYREFPGRFTVDEGGKFGSGIPRHEPEVDFDYSNMSDEELGYFTDIIAENKPETFDWLAGSESGMASRRGSDTTTDKQRIYDSVVDMTGYDSEFGSDKGIREVADIVDSRWKKATPQEREDYLASEGNATAAAIALAEQEGLLDNYDLTNRVDSMTPNQRLGMRSAKTNLFETKWKGKRPSDDLLSREDLSGEDLSGANLEGVDLNNKNLTGADLSEADLSRANLQGARLVDTDLYAANLIEANLEDANLDNARLEFADLREANLSDANLNEANLNDAQLGFSTLDRADLRNAELRGADLTGASLWKTNLENVDLSNAYLSNIKYMTNAKLQGANLSDADLRGTDLSMADMTEADLRDVDFTGANLDGAILSGANLNGAKLDKGWEQSVGMRSAKKPSSNDFDTSRFLPSLADRENYIASDEYEADLEDWLTRFPRKTEADFRRSKTFMENVSMFNPSPDVSEFSREADIYDGWSPEEIDSGLPDTLWRGMNSSKSKLTPEGKRDINDATQKLSDFSRSSSFGDVYPGAEKFDANNRRHQAIYDLFEDADMPSQRTQDVLNAEHALKEVFGDSSDVGLSDRMQYAIDHIAPTFDSRLALSRGVRRSNGSVAPRPGMSSRTSGAVRPAGFTQRSRTAMLETTAIGSPTGMRSARQNALYKGHKLVPGQERASTNDGQLWASLSPADKQLFAERARARESELIDMLFDKFDIPIVGTDRRLLDDTLSAKERAKILKQTGGGISWVVPNPDAPGHFLLNKEGLDNTFVGEYSIKKKAKQLAKEAREHLAKGEMKEHKEKVTKLTTLLRLGDDLQTLAGARIQGDEDSSLIDKNDSYDFAIDHLHPVSKTRIMDVSATTATKGKNTAPVEKVNTYSKSGSNRPFEFNFSKAQMATPSTAISIPGRPVDAKDDVLRSAGIPGDGEKTKKASRVGGFLDFLRVKTTDLSKADEKARQKRIKKLRDAGKNVGSSQFVEDDKDRVSLLDKNAMRQSRIARRKLLDARPRSVEKLTKAAADNNNSVITMTAKTEDGKVLMTPDGIAALATSLAPGEKEWRKHYSNKGGSGRDQGHALAFIWGVTEMNGTPHAVNEEEFKRLLDAGWRPIKRGTGTRQYGVEYMDAPKRYLVGKQGENYGPGEYWSTGNNETWTSNIYYPEPDGLKGDGPGGIAGLLPPTARIVTATELDTIRSDHRKFAPAVLGHYLGYPSNQWRNEDQDNFVSSLVDSVFNKIPRDSEAWDSPIGQMTLQLIQAMESNPSKEEFAQLREALFRLTSMVNQNDNIYAPLFGFDAINAGSDVMLLMNRAAVTVFADPMHVNAVVSMGKGNGLPSGYVLPAKK